MLQQEEAQEPIEVEPQHEDRLEPMRLPETEAIEQAEVPELHLIIEVPEHIVLMAHHLLLEVVEPIEVELPGVGPIEVAPIGVEA